MPTFKQMSFYFVSQKNYRDSHKQSVKRYHELVRDKNGDIKEMMF